MRVMSFWKGRTVRAVIAVTVVMTVAAVYAGHAKGSDDDDWRDGRGPDTYTIGLFGDMPYNALGRSQYPALLADINRSHVAFSVFDGDLKAGGDGPCADSLYYTSIANFNKLERPLIWVPGTTTGPTAGAATGRARCRTPTLSNGSTSSGSYSRPPTRVLVARRSRSLANRAKADCTACTRKTCAGGLVRSSTSA